MMHQQMLQRQEVTAAWARRRLAGWIACLDGAAAFRRPRVTVRASLMVVASALALPFALALNTLTPAPAAAASPQSVAKQAAQTGPKIGRGGAGLPMPVAEMRAAIMAAAATGKLDELMVPIQWNELPPNFGDRSVRKTLAHWRSTSPDGTGRAWLALLLDLLAGPYAAVRQGRDIENQHIYIWPAFGELALDKLSPALEVDLIRLVGLAEAQRMKKAGHYDGYGIAIGADGTWHAFTKIEPQSPSKPTGR